MERRDTNSKWSHMDTTQNCKLKGNW